MTTLIVSDIHLGARNSQAELLCRLLRTDFDRLIVNGDTLDSLNLDRLGPRDWDLIGRLREIARKRELIVLRGNHDGAPGGGQAFGPGDVLAALLGVEIQEEYCLVAGGRRYLVLHGDVFDPTLHLPILSDAADAAYRATQCVSRAAARWLKGGVKRWGGVIARVRRRAVAHALGRDCQGVITGHTHFGDDEWIDGVHYLNTGCWVDRPCSYVAADAARAWLCHWDEPPARRQRRAPCPIAEVASTPAPAEVLLS